MAGSREQIIGADEAFRDLKEVAGKINSAAVAEALQQARHLVPLVQAKVPKVTGRLRASLAAALTTNRDGAIAGYNGRAPYAGWIEFGGSKGRPYAAEGRYLYPTAEEANVTAALEDAAERTIGAFSWSKPRTM